MINREHGGAEYVFWDTYGALTLSARKTHEKILSASGTDCVAAGTFPCVVSISSAILAANTTASAVAVAAGKANHVVAAPLQESLPSFSMFSVGHIFVTEAKTSQLYTYIFTIKK